MPSALSALLMMHTKEAVYKELDLKNEEEAFLEA